MLQNISNYVSEKNGVNIKNDCFEQFVILLQYFLFSKKYMFSEMKKC